MADQVPQTKSEPASGIREFSLPIFLGAWLVFQIQPVISKLILPWHGGSMQVWTVCLLFFQTLLFFGYAFAFALARWASLRAQVVTYLGLLVLACVTAPVKLSPEFKPTGTESPELHILTVLLYHIGLPYFLLCATGPLLQEWFRRLSPGIVPYRLYALSNAGSLLALVTYPFVIEWLIPASRQASLWYWSFVAYVLTTAWCGRRVWNGADHAAPRLQESAPSVFVGTRVMWLLLALIPTLLLPAITSKLFMDLGAFPFLWILPLTIYLVTLIVCFSGDRFYHRRVWGTLLVLSLGLTCWSMSIATYGSVTFGMKLGIYLLLYLSCCMTCHGELVRIKPPAARLTEFYLWVAAGGALGGIFTGLIAPRIFHLNLELHLGLMGCYLLFLVACWRDPQSRLHNVWDNRGPWYGLVALGLGIFFGLLMDVRLEYSSVYMLGRNFYGPLRLRLAGSDHPLGPYLELGYGDILHGRQHTAEQLRAVPSTYYGTGSGIGIALTDHHAGQPRRVGVIGLGIGTLALYSRPGDEFDFFEINPLVTEWAQESFTCLDQAAGKVQVIPGDARLSLENLPPQNYDILVLDAFAGDAIPAHLLTREALTVYLKHLRPDGILAVHISNKFFDLRLPLNALARELGLQSLNLNQPNNLGQSILTNRWVLLSRDSASLKNPKFQAIASPMGRKEVLWTDDMHSPVPTLLIFQ
ncbi:spermidine synthase [Planctomicrobium sp. SH664]|uniref:spermidine synthase n=1 Tax=Planctomicrobium sp. SH664 TaxID=3448125 RepID=UPI003F5B5E4F